MSNYYIIFNKVSFQYPGSSDYLFRNLSLHFEKGWTGIVGPNGSGKTTLMKLASKLLTPDSGAISASGKVIYCSQRTDEIPPFFCEFLDDNSRTANIIKESLQIDRGWQYRWDTLSHGERKRAQLGEALWQEPEVLCIDEPTNHLDCYGRVVIIDALKIFQGVGLLVSHDRELLDALCFQCSFIYPPSVLVRPGGITEGLRVDRIEQESIKKQRKEKKKEYKRLKRESDSRKRMASTSDSRKSKRNLNKKDHDQKSKIDLARLSGKDATGGKLLRQMESRVNRTKDEMESFQYRKEHATGIQLSGSTSKRDYLLHVESTGIELGDEKILKIPELYLKPSDRIALIGRNGTGKSSLVRYIVRLLTESEIKITYVPQEIDLMSSRKILNNVKKLNNRELGSLMIIIRHLGSEPERLLESSEPSPGEMRKLLLAVGMIHSPNIIIMDEPTNHMDLASIESLENALKNVSIGLLLVSHDLQFLNKLTSVTWDIKCKNSKSYILEKK